MQEYIYSLFNSANRAKKNNIVSVNEEDLNFCTVGCIYLYNVCIFNVEQFWKLKC